MQNAGPVSNVAIRKHTVYVVHGQRVENLSFQAFFITK